MISDADDDERQLDDGAAYAAASAPASAAGVDLPRCHTAHRKGCKLLARVWCCLI